MTEFEQYFSALYDGTILACDKMKRVSEMLLNQFASPGEFHFDYEVAKWHIAFIERFCKQPTGNWGSRYSLSYSRRRGCRQSLVLWMTITSDSTTK